MSFIDHVLEVPSYGWADSNGKLITPTLKQLWSEAFFRINIFRSKRNWIPFINWFTAVCMVPFLYFFVVYYIS
jgi:stearoyl-CoA desaturase (delta-9 desaturase)